MAAARAYPRAPPSPAIRRTNAAIRSAGYGRFERQIPLPTSVDEQNCKADFHDGLLTIHVPKTREAEESRKKIPINADTRH